METKLAKLFKVEDFSMKARSRLEHVQVGKWYKFDANAIGFNGTGYGKVVRIIDEKTVEVEKYFELPDYRPYASTKWYDSLPLAIY